MDIPPSGGIFPPVLHDALPPAPRARIARRGSTPGIERTCGYSINSTTTHPGTSSASRASRGSVPPHGGPWIRPSRASSNASSSADEPPTILVSVQKRHTLSPLIRDAGTFGIIELGSSDRILSRLFSRPTALLGGSFLGHQMIGSGMLNGPGARLRVHGWAANCCVTSTSRPIARSTSAGSSSPGSPPRPPAGSSPRSPPPNSTSKDPPPVRPRTDVAGRSGHRLRPVGRRSPTIPA